MHAGSNWRIVVTGGAGFLGSHVVEVLGQRGYREVFVPRSKDYDLTIEKDVEGLYRDVRPEVVIHLAARVGGLEANRSKPGEYLYDNLMMGTLLMEHARRSCVRKFVTAGSVCAYPKLAPVPFREEDLWNGYPEETNAPYGLAKKMLLVQGQAYRRQYGLNAIHLLLVNLYGPRDNFRYETSHVIPALIRKCVEARELGHSSIEVWGDGSATREFLYVEDAAAGMILALERHDDPCPVNLGSGQEVTVRDLVHLVAELTGFEGEIAWNRAMPSGQPRRCLDTSLAERLFGFQARTGLRDGLRCTIEWYQRVRSREGSERCSG